MLKKLVFRFIRRCSWRADTLVRPNFTTYSTTGRTRVSALHGSFLLFICGLFVGCGSENTIVMKGEILDSPYEIVLHHDGIPAGIASDLAGQAVKNLEERFKMTSRNGGFLEDLNDDRSAPAPADFEQVADLAATIRNATEGAYDFRMGGVRELWKLYDRKPKPPESAELSTALADAQSTVLEVKNGTASLSGRGRIDFGLLAEGSAVDHAAGVLLGGGITRGKVTLGQVTRVWGAKSTEKNLWEIVVPPLPGDSMYKVITPPDGSIAINHPAINGFELNDHPRTRMLDPVTGQLSDSAIVSIGWAEEAAVAGAYSEAFFVMGRRNVFNWLYGHQPAGAYLIYTNQADGMILGETDAHLANCVTDSLLRKQ